MTGKLPIDLKRDIHQHLMECFRDDICVLQDAIRDIQLAANEETKSSAGDKYETARAMAHLEIENLSSQLTEKQKALQLLSRLSPDRPSQVVEPGSLVETTAGMIYVAVHRGAVEVKRMKILCISAASPLSVAMLGKTTGDTCRVNGRDYTIIAIG